MIQDEDITGAEAGTEDLYGPQEPDEGDDGVEPGEGEGEGGQPRDEHGRFASKQPDEAGDDVEAAGGEGNQRQEGEQRHHVPLAEYLSEREKRQEEARQRAELERRLAELEARQNPPQEPERPDFYGDPENVFSYFDQAVDRRVKSVEEQVRNRWIDMTFAEQHEQHGEAFEKAFTELQSAVRRNEPEAQRIINAPNPGKALMRWHRDRAAMQEIGGDLQGFLTRKQEEWLKDPKVREQVLAMAREEAAGGSNGRSNQAGFPPSLTRTPGGAHRGAAEELDTAELFSPARN